MIEISEIIEIITITSNYIYSFVSLILLLSAFVGRILISQLIVIFDYAKELLELLRILVQITCEDLSVFFQDIKEYYNFLSCSLLSGISYTRDKLMNLTKFVNYITVAVNNVLQGVTSLASASKNIICFILEGIELIGSSIWIAVTETPRVIVCEVVELITSLLNEVKLLSLSVSYNVNNMVEKLTKFIWNFPHHSLFGFMVGVIAIYCAGKNSRKIFKMMIRITGKFIRHLKSLYTSLWTGSFLDRRHSMRTRRNELVNDAQSGYAEDKLCIACQDRHKEVLLFPCRHICLCLECSLQITQNQKVCPICRTNIKTTMKVYM